jgi:ferrous iron transport protein A
LNPGAKCEPIAFTFSAAGPHTCRVNSPDPSASPSAATVLLADLLRGECGVVSGLIADSGFETEQGNTLLARLRDLGFVAGARCEVIARMWPAGDPLAVRVGGSTFALRRAEAAAVHVTRPALEPAVRAHLAPKDSRAVTA